jgi:hypothetical protein
MNLKETKMALSQMAQIAFQLADGNFVPEHFHVTEVGSISKRFIDCGGTLRTEQFISFQLWEANDFDHRLAPQKLKGIIELSEKLLSLDELLPVTVEYQGATIGHYDLAVKNGHFILENKKTACLAEDQCGIPTTKPKIQLKNVGVSNDSSCTPGGGCC